MRSIFLVLAFCFAILPGCASWGPADLIRLEKGTDVEEISGTDVEQFWAENVNKVETSHSTSDVLPPLRWTNPVSLAIYSRLADAIVHEKAPDLSGFSEEQVNEAYTVIFKDPSRRTSNIHYGWFATFEDIVEELGDNHVSLHLGWDNDPVFARYKGRQWETPYFLIKVARMRTQGRVTRWEESGIVITPPKPKPAEPEEQAQ